MKTKRKSTPSTRLGAYLTAGVGLGTIAGSADAAIVNIDISAAGYNIGGANGGLVHQSIAVENFTSIGTSLQLYNYRSESNVWGDIGLAISATDGGIAVSSSFIYNSPHMFSAGDLIGPVSMAGVAEFSQLPWMSRFSTGDYKTDEVFSKDPKSFIGFENNAGDFGWLQVTWNGSDTFEILGGAYNDTAGVAIKAGELTAVPEPTSVLSTMGLLASGLMLRRRKQAA